jgi:hypothetical protein
VPIFLSDYLQFPREFSDLSCILATGVRDHGAESKQICTHFEQKMPRAETIDSALMNTSRNGGLNAKRAGEND